MSAPSLKIFNTLMEAYGPQHWWPAADAEEMIIGAILVQQTAWTNVVTAIRQLKEHGACTLQGIHRASVPDLEQWIRPAGFYRVKAHRLKHFAAWVEDAYHGSLLRLFDQETEALRRALLGVHGIGEETADCILLYAARRPVFVIDAYTRRVWERHQWAPRHIAYRNLAQEIEQDLPPDPQLYNEFHALLVEVGKRHCRRKPQCAGCPLAGFLPHPGRENRR